MSNENVDQERREDQPSEALATKLAGARAPQLDRKPSAVAERPGRPKFPGRVRRLGVLPTKAVRTAAFGIISLSIFACGALCLLAVWDATSPGVPWRAITSLGIVAATMGAFAFVNELFGEAEKNDATIIGGGA
ncbi:MAG: hypothetical protein AAGH99_07755 [Planctomycetota bacterium]